MMWNKKGQGMPRGVDFFVALIVLAGGGLPLLAQFGIIGELPAFPGIAIEAVMVLAGLVLLLTGFMGTYDGAQTMPKNLNLGVSFIVLIGGAIPLLSRLGVIGELPEVPSLVFSSLLLVAGLVLFLDGLLGARNYS